MAVTDVRGALALALPPARVQRLRQIQAGAAELRLPTYVVGGFARDLLLGRAPGDYDLVVQAANEADAGAGPRLAGALARQWGGEVTTHRAFGTATWFHPGQESIDFATARTETYARPGALPEVTPAVSILADLSRRDFTLNALAFRVDGEGYGDVLDPYQGQDDLAARRVRVLHSLSFEQDPTRIFRGVRYEQRLGFKLSPETLNLISPALPHIAAVSGERVRRELELIFAEPQAAAMLARLAELGVLAAVHPALAWNAESARLAAALSSLPLAAWKLDEKLGRDSAYLALLLSRADQAAAAQALERLAVPRDLQSAVLGALALRLATARASEAVDVLDRLSAGAVAAAAVLRPELRATLEQYLARWRFVRPALTGDDLVALGLTPGPEFKRWLEHLRAEHLDGAELDRASELALVRQWAGLDRAGLDQAGIEQTGEEQTRD
jgi:tRNA nucleotidyltransferase (CCA-adding enzyme)